jgi:hypothetical protein
MDANFPRGRAANARACRRIREQLCAAAAAGGAPAVTDHLRSCPDCAAFARRLDLARQALSLPPAGPAIEPDPHFPARVLARVARPADLFGWAAFRALPAALGLALALAGLGWLGLPPVTTAAASPLADEPPSSDQLLTWSSLSPEIWP